MHHKSRYAIIKRSNKSKKIIYSIDAQNDYQNLLTQISFYRAYQVKRGQIFCAISSKIRNGLARNPYINPSAVIWHTFNYSHRNTTIDVDIEKARSALLKEGTSQRFR